MKYLHTKAVQGTSLVATVSTEHYRFDFRPLGLVVASPRWLVLGLAIMTHADAERMRMHI